MNFSMKIYLDTCGLYRPLDNKTQIRIILEAEAILGIIKMSEVRRVELLASEVLFYEISRNPKVVHREFGLEVLSKAKEVVYLSEAVEQRAKVFEQEGVKPLDALHLASAEMAKADYFCTCDDKFLKRAKMISDLKVRPVSPLELIEGLEDDS